jgi:hypothetical protein
MGINRLVVQYLLFYSISIAVTDIFAQQDKLDSDLMKALRAIPENPVMEFEAVCTVELKVGKSERELRHYAVAVQQKAMKEVSSTKTGDRIIKVLNDHYAFGLAERSEKYSVVFLEHLRSKVFQDIQDQVKASQPLTSLLSGIRISNIPIRQFVDSDRFQCQGVSSLGTEENKLIKMEFTYAFDETSEYPFGLGPSWVVFDVSKAYFIQECELNALEGKARSKHKYKRKQTPGFNAGGIWLATQIEDIVSNEEKGSKSLFNWNNKVSQGVDPAQFYLSYYGFPEPTFGRSSYSWIVLGTVAVLVLGFSLWRRKVVQLR